MIHSASRRRSLLSRAAALAAVLSTGAFGAVAAFLAVSDHDVSSHMDATALVRDTNLLIAAVVFACMCLLAIVLRLLARRPRRGRLLQDKLLPSTTADAGGTPTAGSSVASELDGLGEPPSPRKIGAFSKTTYAWVRPLLRRGYSSALTHDQLERLWPSDDPAYLAPIAEAAWLAQRQRAAAEPKLLSAVLWPTSRGSICAMLSLRLVADAAQHGRGGRLGGATAGPHGLHSERLKAQGRPPHQ